MGSTPDGRPHVGQVPGTTDQWILAGFNGGGMATILLSAKSVADMVRYGMPLKGVPRGFETTQARLDAAA